MNASRTVRERVRAELTREIADTARRHLATEGAADFVIGCDRAPERFRGHDAVRLEFWIPGCIVFAIGIELPLLAGQPSQHA